MIFRRFIASFLVFVFVLVALPTFVLFGLNRTFLSPNFYAETIVPPSYELLMNVVSQSIYSKDPVIQKHFKAEDIRKIVTESLPLNLFQTSMKNFAQDIVELKTHPEHPLTFDLKPYRAGLVKIAQRLAIHLFQSLPACKGDDPPQFSEDGIATCVPKNTNYEVVAVPLTKQFELSVSSALPDTVDLSLARDQNGSSLTQVLSMGDVVKFYAIGALLVLIVVVAFVLYKPFSLIIRYEGIAFVVSGFFGFLMMMLTNEIPQWLVGSYATKSASVVKLVGGEAVLVKYFQQIFGAFVDEVQKISFVFFALGVVLLFVAYYLSRKKSLNV